jgi:hypothetical protein
MKYSQLDRETVTCSGSCSFHSRGVLHNSAQVRNNSSMHRAADMTGPTPATNTD